MATTLPLDLGALDHYTLIVEDAAAVARFHAECLGFEPLRVIRVNAGSAPEGEHDMLNHVMRLPGSASRVMVVTEGLTEASIFRRFLRQHGPGVHHVAYEVADIDAALVALRAAGIRTTSEGVLNDPLTGLRQIFIAREHGGYFIELIERTARAAAGNFTHDNMAGLARTMLSYLKSAPDEAPAHETSPAVTIAAARADVVAFLLDLHNLPRWTVHRGVRRIDGAFVEVRAAGDLPLAVSEGDGAVVFRWTRGDSALAVRFDVQADGDRRTRVGVTLPPLEPARRARTATVIQAELDLLAAIFDGTEAAFDPARRALLDAYHLEVHQRPGL
jgi:catechol 2,3-dioxygenase-like lactoylglutathione lyase family enzyme